MKTTRFIFTLYFILSPFLVFSQYTSLDDVQGLSAGTYNFDFGDGSFEGYVNADGWLLWMQYQHQGGTNPNLSVIEAGANLPIYDNGPLGTDGSLDPSKWGHGSQGMAASIPDGELWLRWEAETSNHSRKIDFESPVLGKFQADSLNPFVPEISYKNVLRAGHTANLPSVGTGYTRNAGGNNIFTSGPFWSFNKHSWELGGRWNVDDVRNDDDSLIQSEHNTIHRVWVKPIAFSSASFMTILTDLQDHINGVQTLTIAELSQVKNTIYIYANEIASSTALITKALEVVADYDAQIGPLFTTATTQNGFRKDPVLAPGYDIERAMIALQQGLFDFVFTPEVFTASPQFIDGVKFNSCTSFPGAIDPPADPNKQSIMAIRANFEDPWGTNPSFGINGDQTEHAFRPTGQYLAPGSIVTVTVPSSLVGKDYYIRVGAHEWDLNNKPLFKRLDRISKKFPIDATTIEIFNPLGGAIGILVPYGASEGIVDVTIQNGVDAPFYSLKSFYKTPDFDTEASKPAPWAVFETDNVMYTIPTHSIVAGQYDLRQTLEEWDTALVGINSILGRQTSPDKHVLYMISDLMIRGGAYSIGYPMSNNPINYSSVPGPVNFIDGVSDKYHVNFHELGHSTRISKFPGEPEATVNFLYVMALNYGLGEDLNESVKGSFVPHTFDIDRTATHRMVSNTFGVDRDYTNSTTNEVRYQHRGYAHYFEIVNMFDWCALKNFWLQEYLDFENGIDHGINNQNIDGRIIRLSVAAGADLRPLLHVYGIIPSDATAVQSALDNNNIPASITVYNRMQAYLNLIPADNGEFAEYASVVYPNYLTAGPGANVDFGVGWHYQKSLSYDATEAADRTALLQGIINTYYPNGAPSDDTHPILACLPQEVCDGVDNNDNGQIDEHQVNQWIGPDHGYWHDNPVYWSLSYIPNSCNEVIIGDSLTVNVRAGNTAQAYTIEVGSAAEVVVAEGGEVSIHE